MDQLTRKFNVLVSAERILANDSIIPVKFHPENILQHLSWQLIHILERLKTSVLDY